ncbi:uncharacterized protein LOC116254240 isoform X2 [Nymphaea colorata]|uniref:uncharacterized protein LOC116254240 isoform X2 n=1 Tax=Nymphaea colorata TaxID=210225 RepID=UPI00129E1306|nr:uncharacterized protein LOC116254240 isoform X2 [Nymphaea colorata]
MEVHQAKHSYEVREEEEAEAEKEFSSEASFLRLVSDVGLAIGKSKRVDDVVCALHSLAIRLFHVDSALLSGCLDYTCKNQVTQVKVPSLASREVYWRCFYQGSPFAAFAKILLYDIALNWLPCFPLTARTLVFDSFFVNAPPSEAIQALIPALSNKQSGLDKRANLDLVCSNAERLLVLCLFEHQGVCRLVKEFTPSVVTDCTGGLLTEHNLVFESKNDNPSLFLRKLSSWFFRQVSIQILAVIKDSVLAVSGGEDLSSASNGAFSFISQLISRICRRGSADILLHEMFLSILNDVRGCLLANVDSSRLTESNSRVVVWQGLVRAIKDSYAVEKFSEGLLLLMFRRQINDEEAYGVLQILFSKALKHDLATRNLFTEKFLLRKVFPIPCLRWILQFAVFQCAPSTNMREVHATQCSLGIFGSLIKLWSQKEFVQSSPMDQQAYISAAVGLILEKLSKESLDAIDVSHLLLQGVSNRLENPDHLIRTMASSVALAFSKVVDPKNPLFLDDRCKEETVDWEFGLPSKIKGLKIDVHETENKVETEQSFPMLDSELNIQPDDVRHETNDDMMTESSKHARSKNLDSRVPVSGVKLSETTLVDPDEIVDPAALCNEHRYAEDSDDAESRDSEASSESSLQPYDMSDDNMDLRRKFSQLTDIVTALRKSDDPDGVERALYVAENLIRAAPDELQYVAGDLAKALVHVRCSDIAVEGEEESDEQKRQKALVALVFSCPFESLDVLTKLLYSPNVDISQRILILDVLTDGALELSHAKSTIGVKCQDQSLVSVVGLGSRPWYAPSSKGPAGAGPWKEISETDTLLSWSHRYERKLPTKSVHLKMGKSRRWGSQSLKIHENLEWTKNRFPMYAAAFMLPILQGYDKKIHGVDLLGRDFIVLGKLIHLLGVCMKCMALHPEASALASPVLDLISSRMVSHHAEAFVRRSALFTASCILLSLHPSFIASSLVQGNDIARGLEWIRTWILHVAETDIDTECSSMAMACLQLHSEMALQAFRAVESSDSSDGSISNLLKGSIKFKYNM